MISKARSSPSVYVVVLNTNEYPDCSRCVNSLRTVDYPHLKVVLVDNASTDGSAERLQADFPDLPLLRSAVNAGYSSGNNIGIKYALQQGADYILILNSDVVVEPDFLRPLVEIAEQDLTIGIVTPKIFYFHNPRLIYAAGGTYSRIKCTGVGLHMGVDSSALSKRADSEREISFASGCALLIRRSVFERLGLLSEEYFMYFDDVEFCRRVRKAFRIFYVPRSRIYHKCGAGLRWSGYSPLYCYYYTRNRLWYFRDHDRLFFPYSILFSVVNTAAKTGALLLSGARKNGEARSSREKIKALWRGFRDGFSKASR